MSKTEKQHLKEQWEKAFGAKPPAYAGQAFLEGHLAWMQQAKQHGGLKRKANTHIKQLVKKLRAEEELLPNHNLVVKPGTRLIRQYKEKKYEVTATEAGFLYNGKTYGSLSTIALEITGTHWNGKVFFGVRKR